MAVKKDWMPDSLRNRRDWAKNIMDNGTAQLTGVEGWDAARITAFIARVTRVHDSAQATLDAQEATQTAGGAHDQTMREESAEIRADVANIKKSRGWDDGKSVALGFSTPSAQIDPNTVKPKMTVESRMASNTIMVNKLGADSANVYSRVKGTAQMKLLAAKRVRFPMTDDSPPANPDQPEEREYQTILVIDDQEIGIPSDIVSAVWRPF